MLTPGPLEIIILLIIVLVISAQAPAGPGPLARPWDARVQGFRDRRDKEHEQLDSVKTVGDDPEPVATTTTTSTTAPRESPSRLAA